MATAKDETAASKAGETAAKTTATAETDPSAENTGAISAEQQAVRTGVSSDALNPAFASPEAQEQIKKEWAGGAEHTVDAEKVLKDAKGGNA